MILQKSGLDYFVHHLISFLNHKKVSENFPKFSKINFGERRGHAKYENFSQIRISQTH